MIIEVLKENGRIARRDDLFELSATHQILYINITQVSDYLDQRGLAYAAQLAEPVEEN